MVIYFDTETTGLYPGRIIQLSYVLDYGDEVKGKNFYFAVDYIDPAATAVHGITVESLKKLSGGKTFSDHEDEIFEDFSRARLIVAHNLNFDLGFMIAEFKYLDRIFRYNDGFDTMRYFTPIMKLKRNSSAAYKYPKLSELIEYAGVFPYDVNRFSKEVFGFYPESFHNAVFDTAAMFLAVKSLKADIDGLEDILSGEKSL